MTDSVRIATCECGADGVQYLLLLAYLLGFVAFVASGATRG